MTGKAEDAHTPHLFFDDLERKENRQSNICSSIIESVQDFMIKLDMKPCMHLVETSILSLNPVMSDLPKL